MPSSPDRLSDGHIGDLRRLHYPDTGKVIPRQRFAAGQVMIEAGASGGKNFIFILLGGSVSIQRGEQTVAELSGPGVFVGEIAALFPTTIRTATVIAKEDLRALTLSPDDLAGLNGAEGLLSDVHAIIRDTASARVATMSSVERQAAGFPIGPDLLKFDRDLIVFHPTRFLKRDVKELLDKSREARRAEAAAEASRVALMEKSPLLQVINRVEEEKRAALEAEQNRKPVVTDEPVAEEPKRTKRPLSNAIAETRRLRVIAKV